MLQLQGAVSICDAQNLTNEEFERVKCFIVLSERWSIGMEYEGLRFDEYYSITQEAGPSGVPWATLVNKAWPGLQKY